MRPSAGVGGGRGVPDSVRMIRYVAVPCAVDTVRQITADYTKKLKYRKIAFPTLNSDVR